MQQRLENEQGQIEQERKGAMEDGKVTKQERRDICHDQNRLSKDIRRKKHNATPVVPYQPVTADAEKGDGHRPRLLTPPSGSHRSTRSARAGTRVPHRRRRGRRTSLPSSFIFARVASTTADVEDMETAAVARAAARRRVPFLAVRAGSDGAGDP
ncbi:MAG: hypothetical protein E6G23_08290, partial [Actinobacteria bacterium]